LSNLLNKMKNNIIYHIAIPKNIKILKDENFIYFKGPEGNTCILVLQNIKVYIKENLIFLLLKTPVFINRQTLLKNVNNLSLFHKLILNKIIGISNGFFSQLECKGLGFKAKIKKNLLIFKLGFSHKLIFLIPKKIHIFCSKSNNIVFFCTNKQYLFEFMMKLRSYKKPDKYKGKGLKFKFELLQLKEGKKV
jgi:large subunit ribosomal protein L6